MTLLTNSRGSFNIASTYLFRPMICKLGPREKGRKTKGKKKPRLLQQSKAKVKAFKKKYGV